VVCPDFVCRDCICTDLSVRISSGHQHQRPSNNSDLDPSNELIWRWCPPIQIDQAFQAAVANAHAVVEKDMMKNYVADTLIGPKLRMLCLAAKFGIAMAK
jgi:hypothetical protein